ncbi:MAG: response regulator [Candidatus Sericytochromatia bacterium]
MSNQTILIIDDEIQIRKVLRITLEANNYNVIEAENGNDGITKTAMHKPNAIFLDLGLPDQDGMKVLKNIREWYNSPIIILSVRNSEKDIIEALDLGADDYLTKPFNMGELLARLRNAFRHNKEEKQLTFFQINELSVDFSARIVKKENEEIKLTSTEYSLLALLIQNRDKVLTHRYILEKVWGGGFSEETQYLRVYIAQLRKKVDSDNNSLILTESGVGYRFSTNGKIVTTK